jgi:putative two-component system response regulator
MGHVETGGNQLEHILVLGGADALKLVQPLLQDPSRVRHLDNVRVALGELRQGDNATEMLILVPGDAIDAHRELCRTIKFDKRTSHISVICLLPHGVAHRAAEFFDAGADDCIRGEAPPREVSIRIERAIRAKQAFDTLDDADAVIRSLANAVEGKDAYTCGHVERVGAYAVQIGRRLGLLDEHLQALRCGGVVHDIGKIGVPDQILNKPGKLTDDEMAVMRRHPVIGYDILKPLRTFRHVLPIVRWHHEKPNGSGYPDGLKGDDIPLTARIIAVADVFDALSTDRPYRKAFDIDKCLAILADDAAKGSLDAVVVATLTSIVREQALAANASSDELLLRLTARAA